MGRDRRNQRHVQSTPGDTEFDQGQEGIVTTKTRYDRAAYKNRTSGVGRKLKPIKALNNKGVLTIQRNDFLFRSGKVRKPSSGRKKESPAGDANMAYVYADFSGMDKPENNNYLDYCNSVHNAGIAENDVDYSNDLVDEPDIGTTARVNGSGTVNNNSDKVIAVGEYVAVMPPPTDENELKRFIDRQTHRKGEDSECLRGEVTPVNHDLIMDIEAKYMAIVLNPKTQTLDFNQLRNPDAGLSASEYSALARLQKIAWDLFSAVAMNELMDDATGKLRPVTAMNARIRGAATDLGLATGRASVDGVRRIILVARMQYSDMLSLDQEKPITTALRTALGDKFVAVNNVRQSVNPTYHCALIDTMRTINGKIRGRAMTTALPGRRFDLMGDS